MTRRHKTNPRHRQATPLAMRGVLSKNQFGGQLSNAAWIRSDAAELRSRRDVTVGVVEPPDGALSDSARDCDPEPELAVVEGVEHLSAKLEIRLSRILSLYKPKIKVVHFGPMN